MPNSAPRNFKRTHYQNFTPVPSNARLDTQLLSTFGVRFRSESPSPDYVAVIQLGAGHATSGSIGIGGVNANNEIRYIVSPIISFFDPTSPNLSAVTDFVSIRGDNSPDNRSITLQAFGITGNLLATDTRVDAGGTVLSAHVPGIHSIRLFDENSTVAWDDLTFGELQGVPEPSTITLGIFGMAGFLSARGSRKSRLTSPTGRSTPDRSSFGRSSIRSAMFAACADALEVERR